MNCSILCDTKFSIFFRIILIAVVIVTRLPAPLLLRLRYNSPLPVVAPDTEAHGPGTPLCQRTVGTGCKKLTLN